MRRQHIVSIVANSVEGDSRVIKTARAALNAGHDATIIGIAADAAADELIVEGVRVVRIPAFAAYLKRYGLWTRGPHRRDIGLLVGGYARDILPRIISLMPDVIHSHDMNGLKLGALSRRVMQSSGHSVGWVHDLHELVHGLTGDLADAYLNTLLDWERTYLHTADHLLAVSEPLAAQVADRYHLPTVPTVVHNTPYAGDFSDTGPDVRSAAGLAEGVPLVVFIGRATRLRGCETIVRAIARIPDVHLAFVSGGTHVESMAALANTLGMSDRFHVHPYVASDRVTSFIRTADLGIHGLVHYPNAEVALPNKLFEYLHAGLPVVVSDVASMGGFVEEHGVGEIFIAEDVDGCAAAIRRVLGDRRRYRDRIGADLLRLYSWERQEEKLQAIYRDLLAARKPVTAEQRQAAIDELAGERLLFEVSLGRAMTQVQLEGRGGFMKPASGALADSALALRQHLQTHGPARTANVGVRRVLSKLKGNRT